KLLYSQVHITYQQDIYQLMDQTKREMPPLAGVMHGAAVMDDALISNMDMTRFERVFNPKAQGAWNLHEATLAAGANLDFFVMLSSISYAVFCLKKTKIHNLLPRQLVAFVEKDGIEKIDDYTVQLDRRFHMVMH